MTRRETSPDPPGGRAPRGTQERRLLEAARALLLERFHLGIAHDLRAPLNAVRLNLAALGAILADAPPPDGGSRHHATLRLLEEELGRLHRGIEALLELVAAQRREPEDVDLGEVVRVAEPLLAAQAHQQRVTLRVESAAEPMVVRAPRQWLLLALLGLVVDALEAAPERSSVGVRVGRKDGQVSVAVEGAPHRRDAAVTPGRDEAGADPLEDGPDLGWRVARLAADHVGGAVWEEPGEDGATVRGILLPRPPRGASGE